MDNAAEGTHSETRVRFEAVQLQAHESEITLKYNGNRIDVHLGFLQVNRHYNVTFVMQDDLGEDLTFDPLQNLHARIIDYAPSEDGTGHKLVIEFHAHREKLLQERVTVKSQDSTKYRELHLHARVLGKGKGTPALRNGIHCCQVDDEDDSDAQTDWQGFD